MKPKFYLFLILILSSIFSLSAPVLHAVDLKNEEEKLDEMILGDEGKEINKDISGETLAEGFSTDSKWDFFGFFESENFFHADGKKKFTDANIIKLETRGRLNAKYGRDFFYAKASLDVFYYPERNDLNNPNPEGRVEAQEIYLAWGEQFQVKLGKQLFNWGSADAFPVTNYLDQTDLRELFAKDKDDQNRGVFSADLKILLGDFSLELAIVPIHSPTLLPHPESFWAIKPGAIDLIMPSPLPATAPGFIEKTINPQIVDSAPKETQLKNVSGALRAGGTIGILDFHLSYFNGIDKSIIFQQELKIDIADTTAPEISQLTLSPYYAKVESIGLDLALNWARLTTRGEVSFTPKKWAMQEGDFQSAVEGTTQILTGNMTTAKYIAYTVGMDINLWGADSRILLEWNQGQFIENEGNFSKEFLTDILVIRLEDAFFDQRLKIEATALVRPIQKNFGYIPSLDISWDFQNGLKIFLGAMYFIGKDDALIAPYEENDFVYLRAKMDF